MNLRTHLESFIPASCNKEPALTLHINPLHALDRCIVLGDLGRLARGHVEHAASVVGAAGYDLGTILCIEKCISINQCVRGVGERPV